ncbi:NblA/ycf18 family protein [Microcoleus sp. F6_B4]
MTNEGTNEGTGKDEIELTEFTTDLTIEQQFKLKLYADQTQSLSAEEAQILLIEMMRRNMIKDNVIRHLLNPNKHKENE